MAFNFNWKEFDESVYEETRKALTSALNRGQRPDVVCDRIDVHELHFGTIAPELELLEIGELGEDRFRGMLKLNYSGDAYLVLKTKVQVNPVKIKSEISIQASRGMLAAHQPLIVPMLLRLSQLRLRGIISLSVSKNNGVTFVFKNDPLQSVDVSSSFDGFGSVKSFLQTQIEDKLRNLFQDDLPILIHSFSHKFLNPSTPNNQKAASISMPVSPTDSQPFKPSKYGTRSIDPYISARLETLSLPDMPTTQTPSVFRAQSDYFYPNSSTHGSNSPHEDIKSPNPVRPRATSNASQPQPMAHFSPTARKNFSLDHLPSLDGVFAVSGPLGTCHHGLVRSPQPLSPPNEPCPPPPTSPQAWHRVGPIQLSNEYLKSPPTTGLKMLLQENSLSPPFRPNLTLSNKFSLSNH